MGHSGAPAHKACHPSIRTKTSVLRPHVGRVKKPGRALPSTALAKKQFSLLAPPSHSSSWAVAELAHCRLSYPTAPLQHVTVPGLWTADMLHLEAVDCCTFLARRGRLVEQRKSTWGKSIYQTTVVLLNRINTSIKGPSKTQAFIKPGPSAIGDLSGHRGTFAENHDMVSVRIFAWSAGASRPAISRL